MYDQHYQYFYFFNSNIYIFHTLMSSFITTPNSLTNHVQIMFWHSLKQHGFYAYSLLLLFFFFSFMSECFYPYSKFINLFTHQEMPTYCIMTFQVNRKGELTLSIAATSFSSVTSTSSFSSITSTSLSSFCPTFSSMDFDWFKNHLR